MAFLESTAYTAIIASTANEPWIDAALGSIRKQELASTEIIVVVNGVDAESSPLVRSLGAQSDTRVMTLPVASQSYAMAEALAVVRTPYVAFLDADDAWTPTKQRRQIEILVAQPGVDAVAGRVRNFTEDGMTLPAPGAAGATRMFGATTFRTHAFTRFGMPDATATHFTWMYRWWLAATAQGIVVAADNGLALERRVHDANSWVLGRDDGRQQLLTEIRSAVRGRREAG